MLDCAIILACHKHLALVSRKEVMNMLITILSIVCFLCYLALAIVLLISQSLLCVALGAFMLAAQVVFGLYLARLVLEERYSMNEELSKSQQIPLLVKVVRARCFKQRH